MGLGGTVQGSFFKAPEWVDLNLAPGRTNQAKVYGSWTNTFKSYATSAYFFYSPNLVWFLIAATTYYLFPYDFEAPKQGLLQPWLLYRLCVNWFVTFSYFGFWNIVLYIMGWAKRKFNPTNNPSRSTMFHNIWYSALGVIQWTLWEGGFIYAYSTGRLSYQKDGEIFESYGSMAKFALWCLFVPLWRDFHFYFAHRTLHLRCLYKFVHSLHHRNTDIEPFAGLCMHPVEHLFYFGCVGPSLIPGLSPFIMMWNGIHLLISPAASHSGWEDHFQSDQFHYLHHAKFECNYGTSGPPLDKLFGTFREKLGPSHEFKGVSEDIKALVTVPDEFLSGSLSLSSIFPSRLDEGLYNAICYAVMIGFIMRVHEGDTATHPADEQYIASLPTCLFTLGKGRTHTSCFYV
jgi:sterol desaturase/sphingolipid hydroxylase (fatty acid hydroxylase superfamily)